MFANLIKSVKSFVQRHRGMTAFFGASLVFATYLIKDEMRENAKDDAQDVDSKITQFSTYMQTCDIINQIQIMRVNLLIDLNSVAPQSSSGINWNVISAFNVETDAQSASVISVLAAAKEYISQGDFDGFSDDCNDILKKKKDLADLVAKAVTLPAAQARARLSDIMTQSGKIGQSLDVQLSSIREFVTKHLLTERVQAYHHYNQMSAASYFLYSFGWLAGLAGKLLGNNSSDD